MKVAVKKLKIEDPAKVQMLVGENIDAIEPGLVVLDSCLLLGNATIDVIGLDTNGALVLIVTGLTADEEMLLKAVEAYSWCREYPESLERLYPTCVVSEGRPPRLLFVVERMPEAFHRKIKQLGFPEVDGVEFRLLDVEGGPAVYFESVLRLRRNAPAPAAAPASEMPVTEMPSAADNVIAMNGPVAARATSLKLQKLAGQSAEPVITPRASERPVAAPREPAAVVSMVSRQSARPRVEPLPSQPEPVLVPGPLIVTPEPVIATPEPVVVAPGPMIVTPEPVVLPKAAAEPEPDLDDQLQSYLAAFQLGDAAADATKSAIAPVVASEPDLIVHPDPIVAPALESVAGAETGLIVMDEPEAELIVVDEPEPIDFVAESIVAAGEAVPSVNSASSTGVPQPKGERSARNLPELSLRPSAPITVPRPAPLAKPAAAASVAEPHEARVSFKDLAGALLGGADLAAPATPIAAAIEPADGELEAQAPADLVIEPEGEAATPGATTLPQGMDGLKFPSDGVLTRQWMEFLSQVSTK